MSLAGDPVVAFFPTDHYYSNEAGFSVSVDRAVRVAQHHSDTLVVLGAEAEHAEVEYGWIEPGTHFDSPFTNALAARERFWEKPSHPTGSSLVRSRMFVEHFCDGRAGIAFSGAVGQYRCQRVCWMRLWVAHRYSQGSILPLRSGQVVGIALIGRFLASSADTHTRHLAVLRVGDIGWSDLGTPERVRAAMRDRASGPGGRTQPVMDLWVVPQNTAGLVFRNLSIIAKLELDVDVGRTQGPLLFYSWRS